MLAEVIDELRAAGLDDLIDGVDDSLFGTAIDPRLQPLIQARITRMLDLGVLSVVFVAPPDVQP